MCAVSIGSAQQQPGLRSRAEISNYEGRDVPLLVFSDPKVTTPEAARKPDYWTAIW